MPIPSLTTVNVTISTRRADNLSLAGGTAEFTLTRQDYDGNVVVPVTTEIVNLPTDGSDVVAPFWPNTRGTQGSQYQVAIKDANGIVRAAGLATIGPGDSALAAVLYTSAPPSTTFYPTVAPSAGQILVGNAGGTAYSPQAVSGDATIDASGKVTLANTTTARSDLGLGTVATQNIPGLSGQVVINNGGTLTGDTGLTYDVTNKALVVGGGTVTASTPVANWSQTWNAGAITFTGLKLNITDAASAAGSLLADLQVATVSKWKVDKSGNVTAAGTMTAGGKVASSITTLTLNANGADRWQVDASGNLLALSSYNLGSSAGYLASVFVKRSNVQPPDTAIGYYMDDGGGANNSYMAWYRNGSDWYMCGSKNGSGTIKHLSFGIGDNPATNAFVRLNTGGWVEMLRPMRPSSYTVGTLPSASTSGAGALATATDLTSLTNGSTATGGGSLTGTVKSNGTNWIVLG